MAPDDQPLAGRAGPRREHRCPRCHRLLAKGELPKPIELHCPKCKRKVVVGGPLLRGSGDLS